jgi:hypothetical protein
MRVFPIGSYYFVLKTTPSLPSSPSTFSILNKVKKVEQTDVRNDL